MSDAVPITKRGSASVRVDVPDVLRKNGSRVLRLLGGRIAPSDLANAT
jgi:hypothetical protein